MTLMRVTKTELIFPGAGGERAVAHGLSIPEDAYDLNWDSETLTLNYVTPPETEEGEPTLGSLQVTQEQIEDAIDVIQTPEEPPVPQSVTPRQIRLALIDRGIMPEQITAMLSGIEDTVLRAKALAEWEFASEVKRTHPLIAQLAGALEFGAEDVDDVFRKAKAIGE